MMAAPIGCDLCQQENAVMMQTNIANGDVIAVGDACIATFFASALTSVLSNAAPEVIDDLAPALLPLVAIIGPVNRPADSLAMADAVADYVDQRPADGQPGDTSAVMPLDQTPVPTAQAESSGPPAAPVAAGENSTVSAAKNSGQP